MLNRRKLSEIANIQTGIYAKADPLGEVFYIQSRHFNEDHEFDYSTKPELAHNSYYTNHFLVAGDIIVAAKGNHFYAVEYKGITKPAVASSTFLVIRIKEKAEYFPPFVSWQLNTSPIQKKLNESAKGTSIPSLTKVALGEIVLDFPAINRQKKIAHLDTLNKCVKKLRADLNTMNNKKIELELIKAVNK